MLYIDINYNTTIYITVYIIVFTVFTLYTVKSLSFPLADSNAFVPPLLNAIRGADSHLDSRGNLPREIRITKIETVFHDAT